MLRRRLIQTITALVISLNLCWASTEQANVIPIQTQLPQIMPSAPTLDANAYILIDANSGKVLAEKNSDSHIPPASLTKLMTVYLIFSALKSGSVHLSDPVLISSKAWKTGGSRSFMEVGDHVPVSVLLQGIIVASGNDATVAMAEQIAGSEDTFVSMMNAQAQVLGMKNTHYADSNGLPDANHYSSARDFSILVQALIRNFPEYYKIFSQKSFTYQCSHCRKPITQENRNRLLWQFPSADGLKTGHTDAAGYCLIGSAVQNGTRLISVVMGTPSESARTEDSIRLLTYGFRFFETHKLYDANQTITKAKVLKGVKSSVNLGVNADFFVTMPLNQSKNIKVNMNINTPLSAPIIKDQAYGTVTVTLNKQVLASQPLIALSDDAKGGFFSSIIDSVSYKIGKIFSRTSDATNNS